jgi:hypothetical protein
MQQKQQWRNNAACFKFDGILEKRQQPEKTIMQ